MNPIHIQTLKKANQAAIYNIYLYLAHKTTPSDNESLRSIVSGLESALRDQTPPDLSAGDVRRLRILRNAVDSNTELADSEIGNLTRSKSGLTACSFTNPGGDVFVVFRGTGSGEWIDNGEGLSGIPEENTYITYGENGTVVSHKTIQNDYATDQQVEALNWFNRIAALNGWNDDTKIIISGHSKGGNKAQFITIHSDLVDECFSFDGHGFSPEALADFRKLFGAEFDARRRKIYSFATDNDFVNVLGDRLMPESQIYYFKSSKGFHYMEAMLGDYGRFRLMSEQGELSRYIEKVSEELMNMSPFFRRYATLGIMNIFQKYLGEGTPVNSDTVSVKDTIAGIGIAIGALINSLGIDDISHRVADQTEI